MWSRSLVWRTCTARPFATGPRRSSRSPTRNSAKSYTNTAKRSAGFNATPWKRSTCEENMSAPPRCGVIIDVEKCKGCGLCVDSCPPGCLKLAPELSKYGVHPATYSGEGCTGCGACFYCCPEPGAITVYRLPPPPHAALLLPEVGGTFLQAESEVAAINMVYGASSAGIRVMSASSGPGLSLMQEGMSYIAGAELPCVIVDVVRGGPGLGNIAPEQSDYNCVVKGGGHGCYRNIVLAPASVQEMFDLTVLAFELADRYRNPAVIMTDGYVGQMQEPLEIKLRDVPMPEKDWAVP